MRSLRSPDARTSRGLCEALAYKEFIINLYPQFEQLIKSNVAEANPKTVADVWVCFKTVFEEIANNKPESLADFGIQTELYLGSETSAPSFYFSLYYRIECEYEGNEYSFYEMVYCDFDISSLGESTSLKNESLEVWESDHSVKEALSKIENWWAFNQFKNHSFPLRMWSTEV